MKPRVLVIDDDEAVLQSCETILEDAAHEVHLAATAEQGLTLLRTTSFDLALVDFKLPGMNGFRLLEEATRVDPELVLIMFTAYATFDAAVEAVKIGAFNYIPKPFTAAQLLSAVSKGLEQSRFARRAQGIPELACCCALHRIVGRSVALQNVLTTVAKVAPSDANVLITGPSGTGKELIARALHASSPRNKQPFVAVDCAALPAHLLESELFGYEKGAFTGAVQAKRGLLETANGGTVFFDEIGEMNAELQAKLLRTLQERSFRHLGSERLLSVDIRIVSSTNRDLPAEVQAGRFREDLLYRLNVMTVKLPALRDRDGDVRLLAEYFVQMFARAANRARVRLHPDVLDALENYAWPGNIRELRNILERAVVLCEGDTVRLQDLPETIRGVAVVEPSPEGTGYKAARDHWVDRQSREYLTALLQRHTGNISAAAREAQISRKSFYELLHRFDIEFRPPRGDA